MVRAGCYLSVCFPEDLRLFIFFRHGGVAEDPGRQHRWLTRPTRPVVFLEGGAEGEERGSENFCA